MTTSNLPVEALTLGFPSYPLTLAWGETVPLYYVGSEETQLVILGIPRSRHTIIMEIQSQLSELAKILLEITAIDPTIALVFSGDLSHVHLEDGPYGFHNSGGIFDNLVIDWSNNHSRNTFEEFLQLQPTALACGMAGMSIIQSIFDQGNVTTDFSFYGKPTYFGMPVMKWTI